MTGFNPSPQFPKIPVGESLPKMVKHISQEKINRYAEASGDFNPIHVDEDFAKKTLAGGTIAHGMLILAYISQMLTAAFGQSWLANGKLSVRFKAPARPGDTITVSGKVQSTEKKGNETLVNCNVFCHNQKGEPVITGEASVKLSDG